jgi:general L-amino acid transport system permease protein
VRVRFGQFIFGFYPVEQRWRVLLAFFIPIAASIGLLLKPLRAAAWRPLFIIAAMVILPVVSWMLLYGGYFGLPEVETSQWGGLTLTILISVVGIMGSLPIGIILALGRRSKMPFIRSVCVAFIELWRGVPLITVLFMASVMLPLFLPDGVNFNKLLRALIGITLFSSAYMAEVVRGGLQAIPSGQIEAAHALGLSHFQSIKMVVLPQALRLVIPGIVNTFIGLVKDTSLVTIIGMFDLLGMIQAASADPNWLGSAIEGYLFAGLCFFVICYSMSVYSQKLERRLQHGW